KMKEIILKIPVSKNATEWILFINENLEKVKKSNCNKLVIDFSDVKFIDTNHFVVLACLIESFYLKEFEVSFRGGSERINNHLNNIRFKDYWKPDFDRTDYKSPSNNTTLCLWKITNDRIDPYSQYARAYF